MASPAYNRAMFAPQQNWKLYEERVHPAHTEWLRGLSVAESLNLYAELHEEARRRPIPPEERRALDARHSAEKLEVRLRMLDAFRALDRLRVEAGRE